MNRTIITYGDYFMDFYAELEDSLQEKFDYVLELVKTLDIIPKRFFQHLEGTDGLFEIRVEFESNIYRTFCFFDAGHLVIYSMRFRRKLKRHQSKSWI